MRLLLLLAFIFLNSDCIAQDDVVLHIGKFGKQHKVMDRGYNIPVKVEDFKDDPKMYISATDHTYKIVSYEMAIAPEREEIVGPLDIKNDNKEEDVIEKYKRIIKKGTEIHYKNIVITCQDCDKVLEPILAEPFVITLE